jgi:hypothetical protein
MQVILSAMMNTSSLFCGGNSNDPVRRMQDRQLAAKARLPLLDEIKILSHLGMRIGRRRRLILAYLNSDNAKLHAAARVLPFSATDGAIRRLAGRVQSFAHTSAPVIWRYEPKRSNTGYRIVCDLPDALKASHYMINDVLQACYTPSDHIFDIRGRGRDDAARAVKAALEAGYIWCFVGDVRDCYQHVSPSALLDLPLPRLVIESTLEYHHLCLRRSPIANPAIGCRLPRVPRWNGPQGLLQGSPASNIILAQFFKSMGAAVEPHDCKLIVYSDNILIAAKSDEARNAITALIREYLHEHPAGPFDLKDNSRNVPLGEAFEFLGYRLAPSETSVHISMSFWGQERLHDTIEEATERDIARGDGRATETVEAITDHFGGYRAIDNWELLREEAIRAADEAVEYEGWEEHYAFLLSRMGMALV